MRFSARSLATLVWLGTALTTALAPSHLSAQGAAPAVGGLAAGTLVGTGVALGSAVAVARFGRAPVDGPSGLVDWPLAIVAGGALSGVALGASNREALGDAVVASALIGALGFGVGALIGRQTWSDPAGPWSGAALGAGVGMLTGWIVGALVGSDGGGAGAELNAGLTLAWRLPSGALR